MIKKILVPLAFSRFAKGILNYAADLAEVTGAEILIVNIINERDLKAVDKITSFGYKVDIEHYTETIKKERLEKLEELLADLTLPDEKVTYVFSVGEPTDELLKLIVDREIDMVVMGVRANDIRHIFTGSVAERMFRKCPVPIVSYRGDDVSSRLRKRIAKHRE